MKNYKEYIFDLICVNENIVILNKNENMFNYMTRCKSLAGTTKPVSLFNKNTLRIFDNALRLIANILFERIPRDEEIELGGAPEFEEFKKWLAILTDTDVYSILYYLNTRGYIDTNEDENLQYMLNVFYTVKVM